MISNLDYLCQLFADAGIPIKWIDGCVNEARPAYADQATPAQRAQGDAIIAAFDWTRAADRQAEEAAAANESSIKGSLASAILAINAAIAQNNSMVATAQGYLPGADVANAAQVRAQVKALTQGFIQLAQNQNAGLVNQRGIIRLQTRRLESADAIKA